MSGPYIDQDSQYGTLLANVLNPPDEGLPVKSTATEPPGGDIPAILRPNADTPAPAPRATAPAPKPATVTPSGTASGGKSWADYVRQSSDASLQNLDRSAKAAGELESQPSAASKNAPLEQQRVTASQPTPYRDPKTGQVLQSAQQYKPGIGTRILRGIDAVRKGGILAVADPASAGATSYGAPNRTYQVAEAARQAQVASLDQQMKQNLDTEKAESERLGKIGSEARATATGLKDVAAGATAQQNAESRAEIDAANAGEKEAKAALEQNKVPKTYEETVAAAAVEKDPARKAALESAAKTMADTEKKKFAYAAKATGGGGNDDLRQSMIDQATADIQKLNDYQYDPEANDGKGGFFDPASPKKIYTPQEFTDQKNKISTKLDADLAKKKQKPLRVRFNVAGTTPGVDAKGNLTAPGQKAPASGDAQYAGEPTQQELAGGLVFQNGDQKIAYRNGAYRDVKTGKPVSQ